MRFLRSLTLTHQTSPANPPSGTTGLFFTTGDEGYIRTSAGVERPLEPGLLFAFSYAGTLATGTGTFRLYNDRGITMNIRAVRASVGTAPTGASVIVDVNIGGATIFATQGNRPTIAASGNTSGKVTNMNTTTLADGAYLTVDIDQVGSTVPGADLTVQVLC